MFSLEVSRWYAVQLQPWKFQFEYKRKVDLCKFIENHTVFANRNLKKNIKNMWFITIYISHYQLFSPLNRRALYSLIKITSVHLLLFTISNVYVNLWDRALRYKHINLFDVIQILLMVTNICRKAFRYGKKILSLMFYFNVNWKQNTFFFV